MIRLLLLLVFAFTAGSIFSQKDTERIDSLNFKSELLYASDVEASIKLSTQALHLAKKSGYQEGEAFASMNLGVANDMKGNSKVAVKHFQRAIQLYKKLNDGESLSYCYSQLGVCYFSQYQYENAAYYHQKAIDLCRKLKLEIDLADALVNQGITFTYQEKPREAEANFREAIDLYTANSYPEGLGAAYNSLGKIYHDEKNLEKAISYFKKSAANFREHENYFNLASAYNGLANCYYDQKEYRLAEENALKSLEISKETGAAEREVFAHEMLSRTYFALGDYKKAYESLNRYTVLSDTIFTQEKSDALAEMQARFEVKEVKMKQQAQTEKHQSQVLVLVILILIILLVSILMFFLFRNKRQVNKLLEQQVEQKDLMMGEIHHRVKNNLQMIYAILDLQAREIKDPASVRLIEDSLNRINAISKIHRELYQSENLRAVRIRSYLHELVGDIVHHFSTERNISLHLDIEDLNLDIETALPLGLIVAELVTNSCKYAFGNQNDPQLFVNLREDRGRLLLTVSDNGSGKHGSAMGTNFGTKLVHSLARKLKAELHETNSEQGLKVELVSSNYKIYHE